MSQNVSALPPQGDDKPENRENSGEAAGGTPTQHGESPQWGGSTKLVVALSLVAIFVLLVSRFLNLVGPLLLAFILAYLFYPVAEGFRKRVSISWRASVTIIYFLFLVLLLGSITLGGLTVVEQVQNLIGFLSSAIEKLPDFIMRTLAQPLQIGPFAFDLSKLDVNNVTQQILSVLQPLLAQAGSSVVSVASGAANLIGWMVFILLVSYFILAEGGGLKLTSLSFPGHAVDIRRLSAQLGQIWNAFLRGQITIVLITILVYTFLLGVLGIRFYFGLAIIAGLARFVPYVGPFIAWTTYGLVAYFQGTTIFGIPPFSYAAVVVGTALFTDVIMDNYVTPRLMSNALKIHPAAVMVSALIALNLLGVIGVVLAAPVLATAKLFLNYVFAKLFDRDPWEGMQTVLSPAPLFPSVSRLKERLETVFEKIKKSRLYDLFHDISADVRLRAREVRFKSHLLVKLADKRVKYYLQYYLRRLKNDWKRQRAKNTDHS